ncbi:hypothetical protein L9F63_012759 [Diploptera punctata]|uniref:Poly [ADP-ribose] polymerase n=1 Tax=Diploptera punctata TaxID=6984 RepID=A0AAD8ACB0_DIPPU|nr:hypothetical protein L9F63_012759 [Diploptera punctata]
MSSQEEMSGSLENSKTIKRKKNADEDEFASKVKKLDEGSSGSNFQFSDNQTLHSQHATDNVHKSEKEDVNSTGEYNANVKNVDNFVLFLDFDTDENEMQSNSDYHLHDQMSSENPPVQEHKSREDPAVQENGPRENPPEQEHEPREDPPVQEHDSREDPAVQENGPREDHPEQEHEPREDPPVEEHEPIENPPVQLDPILLARPERPLSNSYNIGIHLPVNIEYRRVELSPGSCEYTAIRNEVERTLDSISITKIEKVLNPFLKGCYLLKKAEYESRNVSVRERQLFHATAQTNVENSIIKDNLDWRRVERNRFGKGVSFANTAYYANLECSANRGKRAGRTRSRALIRYDVLVGKNINVLPNKNYTLPRLSCDTTSHKNAIYVRGNNYDNEVYVKYYDNEFYPNYVVYYTA